MFSYFKEIHFGQKLHFLSQCVSRHKAAVPFVLPLTRIVCLLSSPNTRRDTSVNLNFYTIQTLRFYGILKHQDHTRILNLMIINNIKVKSLPKFLNCG